MIKSKLLMLLGQHRMNRADLARATGIRFKTIGEIGRDVKPHIPIEIMDKLCGYFRCQPSDLWEWIPNDRQDQ
jgi:putative transcriptional regulator